MSHLTIRDLDLKICQTIKYPNLATPITTKDVSQGCIPCSNTSTFEVPLALRKKYPFTDDLHIENGDFFIHSFVKLPEGTLLTNL